MERKEVNRVLVHWPVMCTVLACTLRRHCTGLREAKECYFEPSKPITKFLVFVNKLFDGPNYIAIKL